MTDQPWTHEIANKWPAARAIGPNVSAENALEYIRRTDTAFDSPEYACNDRTFCSRLAKLLRYPEDFNGAWDGWNAFKEEFGRVDLEHLGTRWIASSYIGGPDGLVSPLGEVRLAHNFGKWPSIEEVESDLEKVSKAFPWLAFDLWLWDSHEEGDAVRWGSDPTHAWAVGDGTWRRAPTAGACAGKKVPQEHDQSASLLGIAMGTRSETTFPISRIEEMWGGKIREAWARVGERANA